MCVFHIQITACMEQVPPCTDVCPGASTELIPPFIAFQLGIETDRHQRTVDFIPVAAKQFSKTREQVIVLEAKYFYRTLEQRMVFKFKQGFCFLRVLLKPFDLFYFLFKLDWRQVLFNAFINSTGKDI